jgi:hypothetical protein
VRGEDPAVDPNHLGVHVRPDTVLRRHRDLIKQRDAAQQEVEAVGMAVLVPVGGTREHST